MAAGDNCNLTPDAVGVLSGTAGNQTTIQIKNLSGGDALFVTVFYNEVEVAKDTASATFTIVAGKKNLTFVYEGSAPGDQLAIVDPCGTLLAAFSSDPGNFQIILTVQA
jgi:hypothetical protein